MVAQEASTASAQVVGAVTIATPAAEVGMTLVAYRWPGCKPECTNHGCDYTYDVPHSRWRIRFFYDCAHGQTLSNPTSGHEPLASHGLKIRVRSSS